MKNDQSGGGNHSVGSGASEAGAAAARPVSSTPEQQAAVQAIWQKYASAYDGYTQGCCPLIADEIQQAIGGEVVAGELTWNGGSCRRTHWWVEKGGEVIDPMGDDLLKHEDYPGPRVAIHRDAGILRRILPQYEQWRLG